MKEYDIAVMKGDGIGPEVVNEGMKVLETAADVCGEKIRFTSYPFGSDYYLKNKEVLPQSAMEEFKGHEAIFFGSTGDPRVKPGILEIGLVLKLRFELDQYINLRPVKLYPNVTSPLKDVDTLDFYVIRENTEDFYNGMGTVFHNGNDSFERSLSVHRNSYDADFTMKASFSEDDDYSVSLGLLSRKNTRRVMEYSFNLAKRKGKSRVTAVDKSNVLPDLYSLWREEFIKTANKYPEMVTEFTFVDAIAMFFVEKPDKYDVVVAPNLFGDIITDLGAAISGGLGCAAGANINPEGVSMFEPIHGSAPDIAGKGIANPTATILSAALMMDNIGSPKMADMIETAVCDVLQKGMVRTRDVGGTGTTKDFGNAVCKSLKNIFGRK
ncbi:isocitrate/isopropylmalate dehydrogenase family protein [Lentibacillus sp. N15]|uniref:isocitrate/isopropylmalate dehydrogenase family protein n=1 Tax=Lentibacillus songyuanensis TaxID=3136161 RepID=UPI0031BB3B07